MGVSLGLAEASLRIFFGNEDKPYIIATIHGFALQNILPPFHHYYPNMARGTRSCRLMRKPILRKPRSCSAIVASDKSARKSSSRYSARLNGQPLPSAISPHELQVEWFAWLDKHAYVTLNEIVYHSGRLITGYRHIASAMASHFAWILVNEFQDSSPGQIFILREFTSSVGRRFSASGIQINRSIALRGRRRAFSWNSHNSFPFQRRAGRVKL
jgi:DNA helicase-2/ATP-dependent DNA helicase PcrA